MKAEERKELETNSLARGVMSLVERAKSGRLFSPWVLAVIVAVLIGGGIWIYLAYEGGKLSSQQWVTFVSSSSNTDLVELVKIHDEGTAAKVTRLEIARHQLGPEGIAKLAVRDREERNKGIENVEKAREELTRLAEEFKGDQTLQATCLLAAAEAELALVGIPKDASGPETRGTVDKAAEFYREVAKVVGENTPAADAYRKRAEELESKKAQIVDVASRLNNLLTPPPSFTFPTPGTGPKAPEGPIGTPKPPEGTGPMAPSTPVIPPAGTGSAPTTAPGGTPPAANPPPTSSEPTKKS